MPNIALFRHEPSIGVTHSHPIHMYGIIATNDRDPYVEEIFDQAKTKTIKKYLKRFFHIKDIYYVPFIIKWL